MGKWWESVERPWSVVDERNLEEQAEFYEHQAVSARVMYNYADRQTSHELEQVRQAEKRAKEARERANKIKEV